MALPYPAASDSLLMAYRALLCSADVELVFTRAGRPPELTALVFQTSPSPPVVASGSRLQLQPPPPLNVALDNLSSAAASLATAASEEFKAHSGQVLTAEERFDESGKWDLGRLESDRVGWKLEEGTPRDVRAWHELQGVDGLARALFGCAAAAAKHPRDDAALALALTVAGALALAILAPASRGGERALENARRAARGPRDRDTARRHQLWVDRARELRAADPTRSASNISRVIAAKPPDGHAVSAGTVANILSKRKHEWQTAF